MKIISIILLQFMCYVVQGQNFSNLCNFETDGTGKSVGLKVKVKYPCNWVISDADRPHNVKKFSYSFGDGRFMNYVLTIKKLATKPSKSDITEMFTLKEMKETYKDYGIFESYKKYIVDGQDCVEVVIKNTRESPSATNYLYLIQYLIIYEDKLITLGFSAGAKSEIQSKVLYSDYNVLFKSIATNFVILSKWE